MSIIKDVGDVCRNSDDRGRNIEIGRAGYVGVEYFCSNRNGVDKCIWECLNACKGNNDSCLRVNEVVVDNPDGWFVRLTCTNNQQTLDSFARQGS